MKVLETAEKRRVCSKRGCRKWRWVIVTLWGNKESSATCTVTTEDRNELDKITDKLHVCSVKTMAVSFPLHAPRFYRATTYVEQNTFWEFQTVNKVNKPQGSRPFSQESAVCSCSVPEYTHYHRSSLRYILIFFSHLPCGLPSVLFLRRYLFSRFSHLKLSVRFYSPPRVCHMLLTSDRLDSVTRLVYCEQQWSCNS